MRRQKRLAVISGIVALVFIVAAGFIRQQYLLPIAMYHSISQSVPEGNRLIVSVKTFDRQMEFLKTHKYNVISLEEAGDLIKNRKKAPARTLVLTFDDGYKDNYTYAFPILKKYNLPATIFIIVNEVGRPDRLSWDQMKEMQDSGLVTFGSHTLSHPFLECVEDDQKLLEEIESSRRILQEKLASPVNTFSYPCGRLNARVRECAVNAGYKAAVATNPGKKMANDDVFALKRLRISENAANLFVFWAETSGYYNFIRENRHK
ncbi:MAG: polysaccharide deacetylase family protein [Candidatus Omnitrophica bacterium]|jgi:peptidoglycan/xylan/chitin deacetylase (PgdA/CDA1 family)|nr:polysaccharide deacetylase family protein [Candidatus Omnitrophota bacterium]MDD5079313.1 polysaccharide deacetylase family protein [Candidatus Omnitrophota bacterium]